uniref:Reverse transcriptase zinc-binding domain-containing protein n=1 Tax=Triticum urartu TaxID=4572 RepID=A0A8R7QGE3_TRIUA
MPKNTVTCIRCDDSASARGWKPKLMVPAGRLTLTQSVLMALPIHFMSVLPLPAWALKTINRRCRGFIWKGDVDISGGHCLLPWDMVCMPKAYGGLGVLNLKWLGYALHCRWPCLRWDTEERPWHQLLKAREKEVSSIFKAAASVCLGDGQKAKFWNDKWLPGGGSIEDLAPTLFSFVKDSGRSVKEALHNRIWIRDISGGILVQAMAQYLKIWDITQGVSLSVGVPNCVVWKWTEDRKFSVGSPYNMFFAANVHFACHKLIWKSKAPPKCKLFMWLVVHRRCLTADNLETKGWPSNGNCPL